jgi:CubicO group peptidase (beta-lactamase class C family)
MLTAQNRGNSALVLIEDGNLVGQFYSSSPDPIDQNSVFLNASMSKWFTAYGVRKLIEEGQADLDTPVSQYLTRWQLPFGEFDNDTVTIRRLLSHTVIIKES